MSLKRGSVEMKRGSVSFEALERKDEEKGALTEISPSQEGKVNEKIG